jgi:folate-binding protein YgfZ
MKISRRTEALSVDRATLYPLDDMGLLRFAGADAQSFLQGQLSCDVPAYSSGRRTYGSYCTPQGRILATFLLWPAEDSYLMQLPAVMCAPIQKRLSMYVLRAKVKVSDASRDYACFGLAGGSAAGAIKTVFGGVPAAAQDLLHTHQATVIRLAPERFVIALHENSKGPLYEALRRHAEDGAARAWQRLDIRAGIPRITPATQEQFIPQMVNLDLIGGVSFAKGCYPGQEIVARTHYRGQVKQRMHLARIATGDTVQAGDRLYSADMDGQSTGMIVNAALAPEGGWDVLAAIQKSSREAAQVHWKSLDGPVLEWLSLPYAVN